MVTIVLADDSLTRQLPQPRIVIATSCDQVRRVRGKRTIPHPALMAVQLVLKWESLGVILLLFVMIVLVFVYQNLLLLGYGDVVEIHRPDARGVVGGTSGEFAHVGREEDAGDVSAVSFEAADGDEGGDVADGDETPDEDGAVDGGADGRAEEGAVGGDGDGGDGLVFFGDELVAAFVFSEVPDADVAAAVAGDELALVGVDYHVVDGYAVGVVALDVAGAGVPDLDRA